ncbi:MAG: acyl-CoA dehydrogenase family protein, partial [Candidatus Nitrosopolaris sp.]
SKYWVEDSFPFELLPAFKDLNIGGLGMQGYGCRGGSRLLTGLVAMEMARTDASIATFLGVHDLAMSCIYAAGSEEQKQKWLPPMARLAMEVKNTFHHLKSRSEHDPICLPLQVGSSDILFLSRISLNLYNK